MNFIFKPTVEFRLMKKIQKNAESDWADHVADGYKVRYPFYASDKPWPVHRLTESESTDEYGESTSVNIAATGVGPESSKKPSFDDNVFDEEDY